MLWYVLTGAIARNRSCPAVSHSCILHMTPFGKLNFFVKKKAPIVDCCFGAKYPSINRNTKQVFPTLLSPNTTTLNSYCLLFMDADMKWTRQISDDDLSAAAEGHWTEEDFFSSWHSVRQTTEVNKDWLDDKKNSGTQSQTQTQTLVTFVATGCAFHTTRSNPKLKMFLPLAGLSKISLLGLLFLITHHLYVRMLTWCDSRLLFWFDNNTQEGCCCCVGNQYTKLQNSLFTNYVNWVSKYWHDG